MKKIKIGYRWLLCFCLLYTLQTQAQTTYPAPSSMSVEDAYQLGDLLVDQYKIKQGQPYLKYAADNGNAKAALAYSWTFRTNMMAQTPKEHEYAVIAAELGSEDAKFVLSTSTNIYGDRDKYRIPLVKKLKIEAAQGDANAMNMLHFLSPDKSNDWLKKAAKYGNAKAQASLASMYAGGDGWFFIPGKREKEVRRLYKASAEQGNLRGMEGYASIIYDEGNKEEALDIWIKMANTGDATSIRFLAARYLHMVPQITYPEKDEVLGAAYSKIYLDSMGTDKKQSLYEIYKENYLEVMSHLSEAQKKQVNDFAADYLKTHTVRVLD
ncbi:sel1 repeat family protein [Photobacterium damselae subsp. damselae]|uniref:tetratricopeptide repeat protein n=2 Tax=Photobacterium damselae TaxID=38293 RepID=UPI001F1C1510|nr:sel1 repeat family protein [Photobacterium damselae]UKA22672.1 sel1 repeat family protein [Photobacterium damselae subsp. damselae]